MSSGNTLSNHLNPIKSADSTTDNLLALLIGIVQIILVFAAGWLEDLMGFPWFAALGLIITVTIVGLFVVRSVGDGDMVSTLTLTGLSATSLILVFLLRFGMPPSSTSTQPYEQSKTVLANLFVDRNRNGVRDGTDSVLQGIPITVRGTFGNEQSHESDANGKVQVRIPDNERRIQVVVCGVAQSHVFSPNERLSPLGQELNPKTDLVYEIRVGLELSEDAIFRCQNQ